MRAQYVTADDVQKIMGVSRTKAYQIIRDLNEELKNKGYITLAGKCPTQFFQERFYGLNTAGGET